MNNFYILSSLLTILLFGKLQSEPNKIITGTYKVVHLSMFGSEIPLENELYIIIKQTSDSNATLCYEAANALGPLKLKAVKLIYEGEKVRIYDPTDPKLIAYCHDDTLEISNTNQANKSELVGVKVALARQ